MLPKCRLSVPMRGRGRMPSFLGMRCCLWPPGSPVSLPSPAGGRRQTTSCLKCRAVKGQGLWTDAARASEATGELSTELTGERPGGGEALEAALKGQQEMCSQKAPGCRCDQRTARASRWAQEGPGSHLSLRLGGEGTRV